MLVNEYETTLVLTPDLGGDAIESALDRVRDSIKKMDGTLLKIDHWGRKKLAYPIEKQTRGIYVHAHYLGKDMLVAEIERNLRISDSVMRYLTVRLSESIEPAGKEVSEYVVPEYDATAEGYEAGEAGPGSEARGAEAAAEKPAEEKPAQEKPVEAASTEVAPAEAAPAEADSEEPEALKQEETEAQNV